MEKPATVTIDLKEHVHDHIIALWKDQRHTDVTFLLGEGKKPVCAHRAILACNSSYFETLLFGEMLEAKKEEISLLDVSQSDLFVSLVEYAYTGKLEIKDGRIQDVLDAMALADRFGFTKLKDSLSKELASMVTLDNALSFLVYGDLYQATSISNKCLDFIDKNAKVVLGLEEFLSLAPSTLQLIISRDTFFAPEISIYEAVIHWKEANSSVSREELKGVLGCVRLSEISARELFTTVELCQLFEPHEITTALRVQLKPEFQNMKPRGKRELDVNLFESAKFSSSGNVEYSSGRLNSPPKITEGVIDLDAPQIKSDPSPGLPRGGSQATIPQNSARSITSLGNPPHQGSTVGVQQLGVSPRQPPGLQLGGVQSGGLQLRGAQGGALQLGGAQGGALQLRGAQGGALQLGGAQSIGLQLGGVQGGGLDVWGGMLSQPSRTQRVRGTSAGLDIVSSSTRIVELSGIYLVNTITVVAFPSIIASRVRSAPLAQWQLSYKIKISKNKKTWETLFDFSEKGCYFDQTLRFPTQAVRYVEFELVSSGKPVKLKFINCSLEKSGPFNFLDGGVTGPLELYPLKWFLAPELPPGHPMHLEAIAIVLNTPISLAHLRFVIIGPGDAVSGDVQVSVSHTWDFSSFKEVGKKSSVHFVNEADVRIHLDFEERIASYVLIHISQIVKQPPPTDSTPVSLPLSQRFGLKLNTPIASVKFCSVRELQCKAV